MPDVPKHPDAPDAAVHALWSGDAPPPIERLAGAPGELSPAALADRLSLDAQERAARGLPHRLEDYALAAPHVLTVPQAVRAVLMVECTRRRHEDPAALGAELASRFPALAADARAVVELASLLHDSVASAHAPGRRLGKYTLRRALGEGAFGQVWIAWDTALERYVALKLLKDDLVGDALGPLGPRRLLAEARAAAGLDHESVVRVHAAGRFDETGEWFIDAQLVGDPAPTPDDPHAIDPAPTLEHLLRDGPVDPREAARIIAHAARGVAAAHARGITHRDLKPSNILLGRHGAVRVADFGLSLSGTLPADARPRLAGTPAYMAPEQARAEPATPLSDVFSLGATLRALLTGRPPYAPSGRSGSSATDEVLTLAREGRLAPTAALAPGVPRTLAAIADRATAPAPESRYASAERLAADLLAFLTHHPTHADPPTPPRRAALWARRNPATSAVIVTSLALLLGGSAAFIRGLERERDRAQAAERQAQTQRDAAIAARDQLESINRFFARTFNSARGREQSSSVTVKQALDLAASRVGYTFDDRPLVEAGVRHFLGEAALSGGDLPGAEANLARALELRAAALGPEHPDTLATRRQIADLRHAQRRRDEAQADFAALLEPMRRVLGEDAPDTLHALAYLAQWKFIRHEYDSAAADLERAAEGFRRAPSSASADRQQALNRLVQVRIAQQRFTDAIATQREIIELTTSQFGPQDISTLNAAQALGWVFRAAGRPQDAAAVYRDALARYTATVGPAHSGALQCEIELADALLPTSPEEALRLARDAQHNAANLPPDNQYTMRALLVIARAQARLGLAADEEATLRQSLDLCLAQRGPAHAYTRQTADLLIRLLDQQGRPDEAAALRARLGQAPPGPQPAPQPDAQPENP